MCTIATEILDLAADQIESMPVAAGLPVAPSPRRQWCRKRPRPLNEGAVRIPLHAHESPPVTYESAHTLRGGGDRSRGTTLKRHRHSVLRRDGETARVLDWSGAERRTVLVPVTSGGRPLSSSFISWCASTLADRGANEIYSPALTAIEAEGYREAGFENCDELWLLVRPLGRSAPALPKKATRARIKRAGQKVLGEVSNLDRTCFSDFWNLDTSGLIDARNATASGRFAVALAPDLVGYAITGWGAGQAYLQRLAVAPEFRRHGFAHDLVADALRGAAIRFCAQMLVNTQVGNEGALRLYLSLGFVLQESRLVVMRRTVGRPGGVAEPRNGGLAAC